MVCETPGRLPANMIVAPNSPSARPKVITAPETSPPAVRGTEISAKIRRGEAPRVRAVCSYDGSRPTEEGFGLPEVKWRCDKDLRHDDCCRGKCNRDTEHIEVPPEEPDPAVENEQGDPGQRREGGRAGGR